MKKIKDILRTKGNFAYPSLYYIAQQIGMNIDERSLILNEYVEYGHFRNDYIQWRDNIRKRIRE